MFCKKKNTVSIPRLGSKLSGWYPVSNVTPPRHLERLVRIAQSEGDHLLRHIHADIFNMGYFARIVKAKQDADLAELDTMRCAYHLTLEELRHAREVERRLCGFALEYLKKEESGDE
ncbi:MAG TPA: hypothetical protein H9662_06750 [Firmicutes bacterium]|nr:hypothetical protein [Bacillota bacterium]